MLRERQADGIRGNFTGEVAVAIIGGGIAGLVAAWELQKRGISFQLLEMEDDVGGNARSGRDPDGLSYPWGAHYVPLPSRRSHAVRSLFVDLGILERREHAGDRMPLEAELAPGASVCAEPAERLFVPGSGWLDRCLSSYLI